MSYPSLNDYQNALDFPECAFNEEELQQAEVKTRQNGLPLLISGQFVVTACLMTQTKKLAIRCFYRQITNDDELETRYRYISNFLRKNQSNLFVDFSYQARGIRTLSDEEKWFPIIKMDWVEGEPLDKYIKAHLEEITLLEKLVNKIKRVSQELEKLGMAHGDLQNNNILINQEDSLVLIDYDGMYVPEMPYNYSNEIGHRNFQHPKRDHSCFDQSLDRFSLIVIYVSLQCLINGGETLWDQYHEDDCLIFKQEDYQQPEQSEVINDLLENYPRLSPLIKCFKEVCLIENLQDIPTLEKFELLVNDARTSYFRGVEDNDQTALRQQITELTQSLQSQQREIEALKQDNQNYQQQFQRAQEENRELKNELSGLRQQNEELTQKLLQKLAKDDDQLVRWGVARNPDTPVELLQKLAKDNDLNVRQGVAKNPNTPVQLLQQLAKDDDLNVRRRVAENPNTPVELLQQLAKDDDHVFVRQGVAKNPNTPVQLLQQLAKDDDRDVRSTANRVLKERNVK